MPIFLARRRSSDTLTAELAKCLPLPRCWCGRCCNGLVTPHDDKVVVTAASVRTVSPPPPRKTRSGLLHRLVLFCSSDNRRLAIFFCGLLSILGKNERCFFYLTSWHSDTTLYHTQTHTHTHTPRERTHVHIKYICPHSKERSSPKKL